MRTRHIIQALFLSLFFAACARPVETRHGMSLPTDVSPELSAIDSLMWQRPDSALTCLLPYFDTCCRDGVHTVSTTHDCHYANLLLAELLYKNDNPQLNRAELLQAVHYYDSLCCRDAARHVSTDPILMFLDARAHYINGVGYYERDSVVEACQEYLKALEVMEERFEEKDLVGVKAMFMAYTYTRLTDLFSDLYLNEQTINFAQLSIPYYKKQDRPSWYLSRMLNEIGSQYDMMQQTDTAWYYYQKALELLGDTTLLMYRDISAHLIYLDYKKGFCDADSTKMKLLQLASNSESDRERHSFLMFVGEILYHEKEFDSAWRYLETVFQTTSVVGLKRQAAEWLAEISKIQEREFDFLEYAEYLVPFANYEENKSEIKSQLIELYKAYLQSIANLQHGRKLHKVTLWAATIVAALVVFVLSVVVLLFRNWRKKQNLETLIETERYAHKVQQAALAGRLKSSNAIAKVYGKRNYPNRTKELTHDGADNYMEEPISLKIISACNDDKITIKSTVPVSAYANIALTDIEKAQLKDAAWRHYGPLFESLTQQYAELKEKDYLYCYLCLLGLDNVQIAALMQNSQSTIWDREKRLQKIFGSKEKIAVILYGLFLDCKSGY